MAVIPPSDFETVAQLRAAMANSAIREYRGLVLGAKVDGVDVGDAFPRGVSGDITYSVGLFEPGVGLGDPAALDAMVPSSRVATNERVIGPRRYTPCKIVVVEASGSSKLYFFPETPERTDPYDCDGNPALELI